MSQIIDRPTRLQNLLDLIITNDTVSVATHNVHQTYMSDHCIIECVLNLTKPKRKYQSLSYRNFNKINYESFTLDLSSLQFPLMENDLNLTMNNLISCVLSTLDKHAPIVNKKIVENNSRKFVSASTKLLIKERDKLYNLHKRTCNPKHKFDLFVMNKKIKKRIVWDSKTQLQQQIDTRGFWKGLKLDYNLKPVQKTELSLTADEINDFFISICSPSSPSDIYTPGTITKPDDLTKDDNYADFNFRYLTNEDITTAWNRTKNKLSPSPDCLGISNKILSIFIYNANFNNFMVSLFNKCIERHVFPDVLKIAKIIPVPKVSKPKSPNELRPISIQPVLAKLF